MSDKQGKTSGTRKPLTLEELRKLDGPPVSWLGKLLAKIVQERDKKRKAKVDELNKLKDHTYTESDLILL